MSVLDALAADADADVGLSTADANADPSLVDEIGGTPEFEVNVGNLETFNDRAGVVGVGGPVSRWGVGGPVRRDLKFKNILFCDFSSVFVTYDCCCALI